jgi:hypothetical protein
MVAIALHHFLTCWTAKANSAPTVNVYALAQLAAHLTNTCLQATKLAEGPQLWQLFAQAAETSQGAESQCTVANPLYCCQQYHSRDQQLQTNTTSTKQHSSQPENPAQLCNAPIGDGLPALTTKTAGIRPSFQPPHSLQQAQQPGPLKAHMGLNAFLAVMYPRRHPFFPDTCSVREPDQASQLGWQTAHICNCMLSLKTHIVCSALPAALQQQLAGQGYCGCRCQCGNHCCCCCCCCAWPGYHQKVGYALSLCRFVMMSATTMSSTAPSVTATTSWNPCLQQQEQQSVDNYMKWLANKYRGMLNL